MNKDCRVCHKEHQNDKFACLDKACPLNKACCQTCLNDNHRDCESDMRVSKTDNPLIVHFPSTNFKVLKILVKEVKANTEEIEHLMQDVSGLFQYLGISGNPNVVFRRKKLKLIKKYSSIETTNKKGIEVNPYHSNSRSQQRESDENC